MGPSHGTGGAWRLFEGSLTPMAGCGTVGVKGGHWRGVPWEVAAGPVCVYLHSVGPPAERVAMVWSASAVRLC
jgi:hypothetical protein